MADKKKSMIARLQHWMDSVAGQTFLNYAYSWGAAVVILGTAFKLTHINGADVIMMIGMGTEVCVFILSGFDRPAALRGRDDEEAVAEPVASAAQPVMPAQTSAGGGQTVVGGVNADVVNAALSVTSAQLNALSTVQNGRMQAAEASFTPEMEAAMTGYVDRLKELTEALGKVQAQADRLAIDSNEMESLNRTLTGINAIYEMQLKNISLQVGTIDLINEQTRKMARQIEELNGVYGRMIKALTVNMKNAAANGMTD